MRTIGTCDSSACSYLPQRTRLKMRTGIIANGLSLAAFGHIASPLVELAREDLRPRVYRPLSCGHIAFILIRLFERYFLQFDHIHIGALYELGPTGRLDGFNHHCAQLKTHVTTIIIRSCDIRYLSFYYASSNDVASNRKTRRQDRSMPGLSRCLHANVAAGPQTIRKLKCMHNYSNSLSTPRETI
jgi:hypothetical protein